MNDKKCLGSQGFSMFNCRDAVSREARIPKANPDGLNHLGFVIYRRV